MNQITIPLDFSYDTRLVSYVEALELIEKNTENIFTNCVNFFDFSMLDRGYDVKLVKENGEYIILTELLDNDGTYTKKQIREAHNVLKLFVAGHFDFKVIL